MEPVVAQNNFEFFRCTSTVLGIRETLRLIGTSRGMRRRDRKATTRVGMLASLSASRDLQSMEYVIRRICLHLAV